MAVTTSGLLMPTWRDLLDTTQLAVDLDLETHKIALFDDNIVPDFAVDTAYGVTPYDANEISGTGYTAGGKLLTSTAVSIESGALTWDAADPSWTGATLSGVMAGLIYADALAGNNGILLVDFVSAVQVTAGTLTVTWATPAAGGIFNITVA
jgi:hypothetical protein